MKATINANGTLLSALANKYLNILLTGKIEESELIAFFSFLNGSRGNITKEERNILSEQLWNNPVQLSAQQNAKGIYFLRGTHKTPRGLERKNSPFRSREESILDTFVRFELKGCHDAGRFDRKFVPLYECFGVSNTFEYYYFNGEIHITG